ncbi:hypothetical protein [Mesorhizobium huakuii]|uniref:Uncharacterized protein n=1 Tax=Mesorhizobium huakuii TaxID=28104 RepID=A0A7G6SQW2_9HYPH|nr:hypothetical protein [Mesorhizobium huakuii]QND56894.1 hypothetical protein HB778_09930 [Mesorhizobium huakuii]
MQSTTDRDRAEELAHFARQMDKRLEEHEAWPLSFQLLLLALFVFALIGFGLLV